MAVNHKLFQETELALTKITTASQKNLPNISSQPKVNTRTWDLLPGIPRNTNNRNKFDYRDFSFCQHDARNDLDSYNPTQILDILSGLRPPAMYRGKFYNQYLESLQSRSFNNNSDFTRESMKPKIVRDDSRYLRFLQNRYKKYVPKKRIETEGAEEKTILKVRLKRGPRKREEKKDERTEKRNKELQQEIRKFEIKLEKSRNADSTQKT